MNDAPLTKKRNGKGGAPLLSQEQYRDKKITVRYSAAEYAEVFRLARDAGHLQLAPWLRELGLRGGSPKRAVPLIYMQHYQELARTNANLNQLAHAINLQLQVGRDLDSFVIDRLETLELVIKSLDHDFEKLRLILIGHDGK